MLEKLRATVEELFKDAPPTKQAVEIKEEILQNTIDRYNDLISDGKSEQAAFNIAVAGIGDVSELVKGLSNPAQPTYSREEIEKDRKRSAIMLSVSVMLYILSVVPLFISEVLRIDEVFGLVMMFVMIAAATGIIIYNSKTKLTYIKSDETVVEDFKEWSHKRKEDSSLFKAITGALFSLVLVFYIIISFLTGAWYITWLVFPLYAAITNIVKAFFDLKK